MAKKPKSQKPLKTESELPEGPGPTVPTDPKKPKP